MLELLPNLDTPFRAAVDLIHRNLVHPYLTRGIAEQDREIAHERALNLAEGIQSHELVLALMHQIFCYSDPILETNLAGVRLSNPLGLAAGFDKNARIHDLLGYGLGFGLVTVGSITKQPYSGNPRPRIFDLPNNDGLINRMGFPGEGTDQADKRLRDSVTMGDYKLVINVAASKPSFERGTAIEDYGSALEQLFQYADLLEVNVSSPNTPGVRGLQEPEVFADLASHLKNVEFHHLAVPPIFYKFGPDLPWDKLKQDIQIAIDNGASGVTLTNTSTDPELRASLRQDEYKEEAGGMSGQLLRIKSLEITHRVYQEFGETIPIIRVGGVRGNWADLWVDLTYGGATVAETYADFVRRPTSTPNYTVYALRDLARGMRQAGMTSMNDFKDLRGKLTPHPFK